jgi:hypothetical protein
LIYDYRTNCNKENEYRYIRFVPMTNVFVVDVDNSHHATLDAAVLRRDYLEANHETIERKRREKIANDAQRAAQKRQVAA